MLHRSAVTFAAATVLALALAWGVPAALGTPTSPALLVTFERQTTARQAVAILERAGARVLERLRPLPVYRVQAPGDTARTLRLLRASDRVRGAEVDTDQVVRLVPNDTLYRPFQWNLRRISMEPAWDLRPSAVDVVVAVLDTGVDLEHPDLRPNLLADQGYDFINDTPVAQDDESHGTAVAGIIGAMGNNREGVAGIAWRTKILPIKALNARGRGPDSAMVKAIVYAVDAGARVLNISSTGSRYSAALEEAVGYALDRGVLIVAAAGNTGDQANDLTYPAAFDGVVAVGAVDDQNRVAPFSQHGPFVALVAPGVEVPSTSWPGAGRGLYASQSGTSIAAPHVAGLAALLWELRPDLSAADLASTLQATATDLGPPGRDDAYGAGLVNAARAIAAVRPGVTPRDGSVSFKPAASPSTSQPEPPPLALAGRRWYFAEGSTNPPFDLWFALQNPSPGSAAVHFTFLLPTGAQATYDLRVQAGQRASLHANEVMPNAEFGTIVESDLPVYVERSMYFGHDGHTAAGARAPARTWYLAEGSTVRPFDTWILLMNPSPTAAIARLTFMKEDGSQVEHGELVPAFGRRSVYANALLAASGFSTQVQADQPIVVERAMYVDGGQGGHDSLATAEPGRTWYLPQGVTRSGFDTWLLVQNPGTLPASVRVTLYTDAGSTIVQPLLVNPRSRASLYANLVAPDATFGARIDSDQPIVAEQATYFDGGRAALDTAAVATPAREWYLPEGATLGSFVEQLAVMNPGAAAVDVQVDFQRQDGQATLPLRLSVPATQSVLVDVNPYAPDSSVALRVLASQPVVVERTLYFARPGGLGGTSSVGLRR